jgi:putative PIN family toxin of toxin-antitoxin system
MIRLVLDTNVVVSGLLWWGPASNLLWSVQSGGCVILTTLPMLNELEAVLCRSKFRYRFKELNAEPEEALTFYRNLVRYCRVPQKSAYTCLDADDQKFIDLALAEHAHMLVSGDKHLLDMKETGDIAIVNVQEAVRVLQHLAVKP